MTRSLPSVSVLRWAFLDELQTLSPEEIAHLVSVL